MLSKWFKNFAMVMAFLAAITLGLGVGNFISTWFLLYEKSPCYTDLTLCKKYYNAVIFSLVMPGVWGSLLVFITGLFAVGAFRNMEKWRNLFLTLDFITAVLVVPAMIIISVINAIYVTKDPDGTGPLIAPYNLDGSTTSTTVLFALPIAVAVIGFIEFVIAAGLLLYLIRYKAPKSVEPTDAEKPSVPAPQQLPYPAPAPAAAYSPYGPLPYRRPVQPYASPAGYYRPPVQSPYGSTPALYGGGARYGAYTPALAPGRPYPMSYMPQRY